jgi:hypothetical protein
MRRQSSLGASYELDLPFYMGGKTTVDIPTEKMAQDAVNYAMPMMEQRTTEMLPRVLANNLASMQAWYVPSLLQGATPYIAETMMPELIDKSWPIVETRLKKFAWNSLLAASAIGAAGLLAYAVYKKAKAR